MLNIVMLVDCKKLKCMNLAHPRLEMLQGSEYNSCPCVYDQHHDGSIKCTPETPRTVQYYGIEGLKKCLEMDPNLCRETLS